jgi:HD superfamily phosphodiesterase
MKRYDPLKPPDPDTWLSLDEEERIHLVREYHRRAGVKLPNQNVHAVIHAAVEHQIALGDEIPVRRVLERLIREGLDRHSAIHAIGSVLAENLFDLMHGEDAPTDPNPAYYAALEELTAEKWLADFE